MAKNRITPDQLRRNLQTYEAIVGQQKAAEKLGVSTSTYRAWKNGTRDIPVAQAKTFNRVYGQNKKKLASDEIQTQVEKYNKRTQSRKQGRQKQLKRTEVQQMATRTWAYETFHASFIIHRILLEAPEFVSYIRGDKDRVQFFSPLNMQIGKPAGTNSVLVYGLYLNKYIFEKHAEDLDEVDESSADMFVSPFPVLDGKPDQWDLDTMLQYMERKFMAGSKTSGRRRYEPFRFIGYELR